MYTRGVDFISWWIVAPIMILSLVVCLFLRGEYKSPAEQRAEDSNAAIRKERKKEQKLLAGCSEEEKKQFYKEKAKRSRMAYEQQRKRRSASAQKGWETRRINEANRKAAIERNRDA